MGRLRMDRPACLMCEPLIAEMTEKIRRLESAYKRTKADLEHAKTVGTVRVIEASDDVAENMPDPEVFPEPSTPTQRYVKRPSLI